MNAKHIVRSLVVGATILAPALWSSTSHAGGVALTLQRATLTNVDDAAGRWQHEGGSILKGVTTVGEYSIHRRVTTGGTTTQNTAMQTITLFFTTASPLPPNNVTLQGAHNFNSGRFAGSVSGASNRYNWIQGADAIVVPTATIGTSTLSVTWGGSSQLTLP
jgi:hypothetical protein